MPLGFRSIISIFFLSICAFADTSSAFEILGVDIVDYGIYATAIEESVPTDSTVAGKRTMIRRPRVIAKTHNIPATLDMLFGYYFIIKGRPWRQEITITCRMIHPPMRNPETGKTGTESSYQTNYWLESHGFFGFRFGQEWELVPGRYVMLVYFENQRLLEQTFEVYVPAG